MKRTKDLILTLTRLCAAATRMLTEARLLLIVLLLIYVRIQDGTLMSLLPATPT